MQCWILFACPHPTTPNFALLLRCMFLCMLSTKEVASCSLDKCLSGLLFCPQTPEHPFWCSIQWCNIEHLNATSTEGQLVDSKCHLTLFPSPEPNVLYVMYLQSTGPGQHGVPGVTVPVDVEKVHRHVHAPAPTLTPSMAVQYVRETRRRDDLVPASVQVSPFVGILLWGN